MGNPLAGQGLRTPAAAAAELEKTLLEKGVRFANNNLPNSKLTLQGGG